MRRSFKVTYKFKKCFFINIYFSYLQIKSYQMSAAFTIIELLQLN